MEPSVATSGWTARQFSALAAAGRTKPLILRCARSDRPNEPATAEFVTKAVGCPEITNEKLFAELFGTRLARTLGVSVADPGVILLDQEFVRFVNDLDEVARANIRLTAGPAFGSRLVTGMHVTASLSPDSNQELQDAASIFAFDMIVQNADRGVTRPNVARHNGRLLAFDFECCFGFVYAVGSHAAPHQVSAVGGSQAHCLWRALRGRPELIDPPIAKLGAVTDSELETMASLAPMHWQSHRTRILDHVKSVRTELAALRTELRGLLS